jgi:CheY-specific phosphatase CheX
VSVEFRGPRTGRLVLRASGNLLPSIAANMLGEAESARTPLQRDALGEIANVITGNVLPLVEGRDAVFHLDAPRVHEGIAPVSRDDDRCEARTTLGIENGRVQAELFFF